MQRDSNVSTIDGPGTHECDEKVCNLICYVDDVEITKPTLEDHIEGLDEVFTCKKEFDLKCKPSKSEILRNSLNYLGRLVDKHGVRPDLEAVEAVVEAKQRRPIHHQ